MIRLRELLNNLDETYIINTCMTPKEAIEYLEGSEEIEGFLNSLSYKTNSGIYVDDPWHPKCLQFFSLEKEVK